MNTYELFKQRLLNLQSNLFSFAYQLTNNKDDAEDLLQETTLKALKNQGKFIENTNFKGWVFTIMRNIFINNYRQSVRQATIFDRTNDLYNLNLSQDSGISSPEGSYAVKEIMSTIAEMSEEYRIPFNLHIAGYKYSEIADKLKLPLGTVKSRIFFTRKCLRSHFDNTTE